MERRHTTEVRQPLNPGDQLVIVKNRNGFTLVEIILTMVLLSLMIGVASVMMGRGADSYNLVASRTEGLDQARFALLRIQREILTLRQINAGCTDKIFNFQDSLGQNVSFSVAGNELDYAAVGAAIGDPLVKQLLPTAAVFSYFDGSGNQINNFNQVPAQAKRIQVSLFVQLNANGSVNVSTDVTPRINLYDNFQYP